jgi:hypothetical protein
MVWGCSVADWMLANGVPVRPVNFVALSRSVPLSWSSSTLPWLFCSNKMYLFICYTNSETPRRCMSHLTVHWPGSSTPPPPTHTHTHFLQDVTWTAPEFLALWWILFLDQKERFQLWLLWTRWGTFQFYIIRGFFEHLIFSRRTLSLELDVWIGR